MEDPRRVAQDAVRDELSGVQRPRRPAKSPPGEDVAERARDRPHLPAVLVLGLGCRLLDGDRGRLVDRAPPLLLHEVREAEVVAELRVVLDVRVALDRVDRAVPGRDRAARSTPARAPTSRSASRPPPCSRRPGSRAGAARRRSRPRVGEVPRERAQRVGLPLAVRVREREHVARRLADGAVLRCDLALARALKEANARVLGRDLADDRRR